MSEKYFTAPGTTIGEQKQVANYNDFDPHIDAYKTKGTRPVIIKFRLAENQPQSNEVKGE